MASKTTSPKAILFLGVAGPSGIPALRFALSRGHSPVIYAGNAFKLPEDLRADSKVKVRSHPRQPMSL